MRIKVTRKIQRKSKYQLKDQKKTNEVQKYRKMTCNTLEPLNRNGFLKANVTVRW